MDYFKTYLYCGGLGKRVMAHVYLDHYEETDTQYECVTIHYIDYFLESDDAEKGELIRVRRQATEHQENRITADYLYLLNLERINERESNDDELKIRAA